MKEIVTLEALYNNFFLVKDDGSIAYRRKGEPPSVAVQAKIIKLLGAKVHRKLNWVLLFNLSHS